MANDKQNTTSRLPPQNIEAEQSVLGALLIDKEAILKVADILRPEDFYKDAHCIIYETMLDLFEKKEPIDLLSLSSRLEEKKQLESVGGLAYLTSLAHVVPTSSHVESYARIVSKKATLRRLITASTEIVELGYKEEEEISILLDQAESKLFGVSQRYLKRQFVPIRDLLTEAFDRIDELHREAGKLRGIATGFTQLDNLLGGLQKSNLIIIASRPAMGKTSLGLNIVTQIATKQKLPVAIFSLEMSKEEIIDRLLCTESNVDLWRMRTGRLSDREDEMGESDFSRIGHAMGILSEAPIFIDDSPTANVMEIRTKARRLQAERDIGLILIDYLQLMEGVSSSDNRVQIVSEISRGLKAVARELNVPVLALSQLSRQVESRPTPIPKLADLRESGSIEQDADVVMFIYRDKMYKKDSPRGNEADIYIAKHRNGPTGVIQLFFDEEKVCFKNLERKLE
jgi:replicative DNA helicase